MRGSNCCAYKGLRHGASSRRYGLSHLLQCPSCKGPIFAQAWLHQYDVNEYSWGDAERLWPQPAKRVMSDAVPRLAAKDMEDAQRCLHHGIYSAAAVLCGRALERLVREKTNEKTIAKGLVLLKEQGVIDSKLLDWANALRHERNLGAHATDHEVTPENAEDVVDFTYAIFEYVYTLTSKFDDFMKRKKANQPLPIAVTPAATKQET